MQQWENGICLERTLKRIERSTFSPYTLYLVSSVVKFKSGPRNHEVLSLQ